VSAFLEHLLIAGTVTVAGVRHVLQQHRRPGRHGVAALDAALDSLPLGAKPPDSVLEPAMSAVFRRFGIDGWVFHHVIGPFEVDFAFPSAMLVVEVDGWDPHGSRQAFEDDRARDAHLVSLGWSVIRVTWRQVTREPGRVGRTVGDALRRRGVDR
jgi:very-short-patch-repair endonuclease